MPGTAFQQLLEGVANYYGSGSDQWVKIAQYGVTQDTLPIIEQVPGVKVTVSDSGKFLGFDYTNPFPASANPASVIDSNVQSGIYGEGSFNAQLPATAVTDPTTGTTSMKSGSVLSGVGSTLATIADKVGLAVVGVSLGTKLGKLIDGAIYSINPEWFDEYMPTINPQTWDDIATTENGKKMIRSVFGIENDSATMYLDERLLAYTYLTLLANGGYSSNASATSPEYDSANWSSYFYYHTYTPPINYSDAAYMKNFFNNGWSVELTMTGGKCCVFGNPNLRSGGEFISFSLEPVTVTVREVQYNPQGAIAIDRTSTLNPSTYRTKDKTTLFYVYTYSYTGSYAQTITIPNINPPQLSGMTPRAYSDIAQFIFNGVVTPGGLQGVSDNPEASEHVNPASVINPTTGQAVTPNDSVDDVLQALKNAYPDLFNGSIYEDIPQPDGTVERITYIPTPYPDTANSQQPVTDTTPGIDPQTDPQVNPQTRTETLIQQLLDILTQDPTAPDTGDGNTPPVVIPPGSANALYSIYNPTQTELNDFGSWLWSSNFVDQLLKLFNDPMQAIIGLHKVFAPPVISGVSTIKVGYLNSGVSSNVVGDQYTTVDCGYLDLDEYFGNVFDYEPFTQVYIYLPFVGIEKLDTGDVMRGRIGVKYHVDVLTGACLVEINVIRDGAGGILYTFTGNCAVQYPISSASYMGIVSSLVSVAGGVIGTIVSGGALAPAAWGAVSGFMNAHARVSRSGSFSGNAGAMGVKTPYLIIIRPQTCLADSFESYSGYPANKTTTIEACSGFIKCDVVHIENVPASSEELTEIEMLLQTGILI